MSNNLVQTISLKDKGYSSGVKSAKQALQELGKQNGVVNNSFQNTSKELNSAKKFYSQLRTEYEKLSDEAKKGEFGQAMHRQLETTKKDLQSLYEQTARTKRELQDMQDQANKKVSGGKGGFSFKQMGGDMLDKFDMGQLKNLGGGKLAGAGAAVAAVAGTVAVLGKAYMECVKAYIPFESSLSNLQAITGVSSKELENFKTKIKETGVDTSKAFTEVADAYTKVGSAMPELLKDADALDAVTRAAITLSKAARMDLDTAINSVTGIMNQFGANASEAERYVNVLAAGAKEGSAGIEYLAQALDKCGTSLATTNMSVEQGTALLEVLAKKIPDASTAGTNLRNILIKMSQAQDKYNPKVVGMTQALQNLQPKIKDTAFMVKLFGAENVNAAITLAQAVNTYDDLTKKVTGTNEAFKQAGIQTDNFESAMKRLDTSWNNFKASLIDSIKPLTKIVNLLSDALAKAAKGQNIRNFMANFNNENGNSDDYQKKETREEQWAAWNKRRGNLSAEITKIQNHLTEAERKRDTAKTGTDWWHAKDLVERLTKTLKEAKDNLDKEAKAAYKFFYGDSKKEFTPTITETTTTDTTKKTKTKFPKEIYDEKIADIEARLVNGYIKEKKAIEEKIAATQQYILALQSIKKKTKQDEQVLTSLKAQEKALEKNLIKATDEEIVSDALENYNDTIKKLDRQRQNGWITESEYQSQYISAIKSLCKAYDKVTDMSDKLIKEISEKQKEIKDFELKQAKDKATTEYLSSYRDISRIYNGGQIAREAPANSAYKAHETAYIQLINKADSIDYDNIIHNPDYKPSQEDLDWFKDYQQYLEDNINLLDNMYEHVENITEAAKHAKKLELVIDIQDALNEGGDITKLITDYREELESVGFQFNFDEKDFRDKLEKLGVNTSIPIQIDPTWESVSEISEIVEKYDSNSETHKQIKRFEKEFKTDIENLINMVNNLQFPDAETIFGKGDASNYSIKNNHSYFKVYEDNTKFKKGAGRLNENLMEEGVTQKMQEELDKYLAKYKDIEDIYVKMRQQAEEKGINFSFENEKIDQELTDLEGKIAKLHDDIQERLTFEIKISGALDAVDALGGISNLGSELASIPDTLDSIEESSNDAAAAFQYFGLIINTVQGIIEGIQLVMTVYKGLTDAFTASETAKSIATEADMAAQTQQAGVAEANIPAKAGEAAANKALEASALDLAAANIFLAHSYIPFAGPAIAAGLTTGMMGTMTGVHATALSLTAMANGGIVGGNGTFSGDQTLIRANKGEMILNTQQQANLFSLLDGVVGSNQGGGKVKFEISGDNLVGVLNNHNRMKAKVGNRLR
jgi:phage tail tape measure protein, TP901 family, core region